MAKRGELHARVSVSLHPRIGSDFKGVGAQFSARAHLHDSGSPRFNQGQLESLYGTDGKDHNRRSVEIESTALDGSMVFHSLLGSKWIDHGGWAGGPQLGGKAEGPRFIPLHLMLMVFRWKVM